MRKTSLGANACSASFVRQSAQAWALNSLRFFFVQLRHCLTVDGSGDCLLTICVVPCRFPRGPKLLSMSAIGGIASTNTGDKV